ncbi:plakophilin-2 [Callorhinchus milii]|uniref:Plakophilin-2 n=1 Tax=Callorhinchus milii TaxID=7868 RepID=A0A4W3IHD5_CALMI|nr:plakophilin-2 [Callorhinchus milii]|eukprot:gi/632955702/ref/XP_007893592.1/ PREDICTED: plakophilin-2 [Callorhinchus milii]
MAGGTESFFRTVLPQNDEEYSSLALPSDEKLKLSLSQRQYEDKSLRLRQQVQLSMSRMTRKSQTEFQKRTFSVPDDGNIKFLRSNLFDYPTMPVQGSHRIKKEFSQYNTYGLGQTLRRPPAGLSSHTRRFELEGLQSITNKPTQRIEVSPENSPYLSRAHIRTVPRYASRGTIRKDNTMLHKRCVSYDNAIGGRLHINARPSFPTRLKYSRTETLLNSRPVEKRMPFQMSQNHIVRLRKEPEIYNSAFMQNDWVNPPATVAPNYNQSMSRMRASVLRSRRHIASRNREFEIHNSGFVHNEPIIPPGLPCLNQTMPLMKSSSQGSQKFTVTATIEPQTPDSVFVDNVPTRAPVTVTSGLSQSMSNLYDKNHITSLGQRPTGVSLSYQGAAHMKRDEAWKRFNWYQVSQRQNNFTANIPENPVVPLAEESETVAAQSSQAVRNDFQIQVQPENFVELQATDATDSESVYGEDIAWTMETAVDALTNDNTDYTLYGANFIQHECFQRPEAKKELYNLNGFEKLVALLKDENVEIQRAACGAMRNGVFEDNDNKIEVKELNGLPQLLQLLRQTEDIETQKQITGLLWNLSSNVQLKSDLIQEALTPLTTSVIIPYSGWPDNDSCVKNTYIDPDVFFNTTGCMRNLSSASPEGRIKMRESEGLIDSLVHYIQFTIANNQENDEAAENCTCILHNLSFQLEEELPSSYSESSSWKRDTSSSKKSFGCFGSRSTKIKQGISSAPFLEEKRNPKGVEWLWHSLSVRLYLSLLARSTRSCTQEASLGSLQNLTAGNGPMGYTISEIITLKENGLQHIRRMLYSQEPGVQKAAVSLLRNMSRNSKVHDELVGKIMPDLIAILPETNDNSTILNDTVAFSCHALNNLIQNKVSSAQNFVQNGGLKKVVNISKNDHNVNTKSGSAAAHLLYGLWFHRDLHHSYKKAGFIKTDFINNRTTKAYHATREFSKGRKSSY